MWTLLAFFEQTRFSVWAGPKIQHASGLGRGLLAGQELIRKTRCLNSFVLNLLPAFKLDSVRLSSFLWTQLCHCCSVVSVFLVISHIDCI